MPYKGYDRDKYSKRGLKLVQGWVPIELVDEVRILCKEEGLWIQDAVAKGLELWIKYQKQTIYERERLTMSQDTALGFRSEVDKSK